MINKSDTQKIISITVVLVVYRASTTVQYGGRCRHLLGVR